MKASSRRAAGDTGTRLAMEGGSTAETAFVTERSLSMQCFRYMTTGLAISIGFVLGACSSASGPSLDPNRSNCRVVCEKAHDCLDQTLDDDACTSKCDDESDADEVFSAKVEECAECAEPLSCSEVSGCVSDCLRIYVP